MIDRVVQKLGRRLWETPVGFKWFVPGLIDGSVCFGGEESAGASFLRRDGTVWTTDKDGLIMDLLGRGDYGADRERSERTFFRFGNMSLGGLITRGSTSLPRAEQKAKLGALTPESVHASSLAGEPITARLTNAPGNGASIGGLKVVAESGWFAARPSGTENIYKIYAESFRDEAHLEEIVSEAQEIVQHALASAAGKS